MSYDPQLDNNYRIDGDRIISERTARNEAVAGFLYDIFPLHPRLHLLVGIIAAVLTAIGIVVNFPKDAEFDSGMFWVYCAISLVAILGAGFLSLALAPFIVYGGAAVLVYLGTNSIGLGIATLVVLPFVAHKWRSIVSMRFPTNKIGTPAVTARPIVGRHVRLLVATTATMLVLLIGWAAYDSLRDHAGRSVVRSPVVASTRVTPASPIANSMPAESPRLHPTVATPANPGVVKDAPLTRAVEALPPIAGAPAGDAMAAVELGVRFMNGQGVTRDYTLASQYFRAAGSNPRALTNLGWMYALGQGMPRDDAKAVELFKSAAAQGYPNAEDSLGFAYQHGRGVPTDLEAAREWYRRAAAQGFEKSIANLAALEKHP
jgi:hypothetical protein